MSPAGRASGAGRGPGRRPGWTRAPGPWLRGHGLATPLLEAQLCHLSGGVAACAQPEALQWAMEARVWEEEPWGAVVVRYAAALAEKGGLAHHSTCRAHHGHPPCVRGGKGARSPPPTHEVPRGRCADHSATVTGPRAARITTRVSARAAAPGRPPRPARQHLFLFVSQHLLWGLGQPWAWGQREGRPDPQTPARAQHRHPQGVWPETESPRL